MVALGFLLILLGSVLRHIVGSLLLGAIAGKERALWVGLLDHPVEDVVVLVALPVKEILEELPEIADVGPLLELERAAVAEVEADFLREGPRQLLDLSRELLVSDLLILLLLGPGGNALPRELALQEVQKHVAQAFEVVPASLLDAKVRVN